MKSKTGAKVGVVTVIKSSINQVCDNMPVSEDMMRHIKAEHVSVPYGIGSDIAQACSLKENCCVFYLLLISAFLSPLVQSIHLWISKHFTNINYLYGPMAYGGRSIKAML